MTKINKYEFKTKNKFTVIGGEGAGNCPWWITVCSVPSSPPPLLVQPVMEPAFLISLWGLLVSPANPLPQQTTAKVSALAIQQTDGRCPTSCCTRWKISVCSSLSSTRRQCWFSTSVRCRCGRPGTRNPPLGQHPLPEYTVAVKPSSSSWGRSPSLWSWPHSEAEDFCTHPPSHHLYTQPLQSHQRAFAGGLTQS